MATVEQLDSVYATVQPLVAAVGSEQWSAPTPCAGWDVRALVTHLVGGNRVFAAAIRGVPLDEARTVLAGDLLGDDAAAEIGRASCRERV